MSFRPSATRVVLSTSYEIYATNSSGARAQVGSIQSINPAETKEIIDSFEIGTTQGERVGEPFELVMGLVRDKTLEVTQLRLYRKNIMEAFGAVPGTVTLFQQDTFFDIEEILNVPSFKPDGTPDPDETKATRVTVKIYRDCAIQRYGSTRDVARGDIREIETATIRYRTVV